MARMSKVERVNAAYVARCLGPRVVGGVYWCGYWQCHYRVEDIHVDGGSWEIEVTDLDGDSAGFRRWHRTAWDRRDRVACPNVGLFGRYR